MSVDSNLKALTFTAVPVRPRHDGWSPEKQIAFIEALAETACVTEACRHVGMTARSAYKLRRRPCGHLFRDAWDAALDYSLHRLEESAIGRALNGVPRPIFYKGEQVGEYREHDERLTMFLLRYRRAARYGAWLDHQPPPLDRDEPTCTDELALDLDYRLEALGEGAMDEASPQDGWGPSEDEAEEPEDSPCA